MALYTMTEFAKLCDITLANLSTYKKREKVIVKDGKIDDQLDVNAAFLQHQLSKKGKLTAENTVKTVEIPDNSAASDQILTNKRNKLTTAPQTETGSGSLHDLNKRKKELEIEKISEETELLKKKNEKMEGELIPTGIVTELLKLHFTSATNQFKNSIENILTEWTKRKDFTREELAELRGHLTGELNNSITKSVKESQRNLNKVLEEFSLRKGVGERM